MTKQRFTTLISDNDDADCSTENINVAYTKKSFASSILAHVRPPLDLYPANIT